MLEIDVSRGNENSGCGSNKEIVRCIYAGGGGAKPSTVMIGTTIKTK